MLSEFDEARSEEVIQNLVNDWGIDEDTAAAIFANEMMDQLDVTMFITSDGIVYPATDEEDLKKEMLKFFTEEYGSLADIQYVIINYEPQEVNFAIGFTPAEVFPEVITVPEPEQDLTEEEKFFGAY